MIFQCKFVYKGVVKENFFREGEDAQSVKEGLQMFDFGKGNWEVSLLSDD